VEKHTDFDKQAFAREGKRIYQQKYAKKLESTERGRIIAIEIESGDCFMGDSTVEAILKAKEKYPDRIFYLMRVGYDAVHSSKGFVPVTEKDDA
jgi:hypothetical protein